MGYDLVRYGNPRCEGPVLERECYPSFEAMKAALALKSGCWFWVRHGES